MRNINLRYVDETYDENGFLTDYKYKYPENYNFAYDVVDDIAVNDPDRKAMIWCNDYGEEHTFTFADMKKYSDKTANMLRLLGVKKGDMVMVILKRHYQFWFTILALHKLGAVIIPATFLLTKHDIVYRVNAADVKTIICSGDCEVTEHVDAALPECPCLKTRIIVNGKRDGWIDFMEKMNEASDKFERVETKASEPMLMYFSSGTTGNPKMVLHAHTYSLAHLSTAKYWHNVKPDGLHLTIADTGWGKAVWGKLYGQWLMESCVFTYFEKFKAHEILSRIGKYKITTLCCPPTMFRFFMQEDLSKYDLSSLEYCTIAGEALSPDIFNKWYEATGIKLMEGFGQTETTLSIANIKGMTPKPGSMGKPMYQYHIDIVDEDGKIVDPGVTGEIVIHYSEKERPLGLLMEYYRDEAKTKAAMHDGLYHTGDTAWKDEDGYFWYVGRTDDVIKSSGYRIGPFEIESVLSEHPSVLECAVTGAPDPLRGNVVKATIVLKKGYEPSEELKKELQNFVKRETAPYKYPRQIEFVDELPKTVNGKIRRAEIRKRDLERAKKNNK